jgi:hypothetical protein
VRLSDLEHSVVQRNSCSDELVCDQSVTEKKGQEKRDDRVCTSCLNQEINQIKHVAVEALCYETEGRWFESEEVDFFNLYLSIQLHYFTYNITITVTMQLNNLICMFSFPFSLHVLASVGHHQVLFPMPST